LNQRHPSSPNAIIITIITLCTFDKAGSGAGRSSHHSAMDRGEKKKKKKKVAFFARARRGGHMFSSICNNAEPPSQPEGNWRWPRGQKIQGNSVSPHRTTLVRKVRSRADQVSAGEGVFFFGSDALSVSVSSYFVRTDRWVAGGGKAEP
jgi:hypothetical protein